MAGLRWLDTNVLLRYFTNDIPGRASRAKALLERIEAGAEKVILPEPVVFEVVFTLQRFYKVPRDDIREKLRDVIALTGIRLRNKTLVYQALDLYVQHNVSFVDAYVSALMHLSKGREVYSWDTDFDKIPGVTRIEP